MISKATEIPAYTLRRRLKKHGYSYKELVNQAKLDMAKSKLRHTSLSIMEIATIVGYSEHAHFCRAFKKWTGKTPGEYRAQHGQR